MITLHLASLLLMLIPLSNQINTIPTVEKCKIGKEYVINHIVFNCTGAGAIKTYKPVACAPINDRQSRKLNFGQTHKGVAFLYLCHKGNRSVEYKPVKCVLNDVEFDAGLKLRRFNAEYECMGDALGPMKMKQTVSLHIFCQPGGHSANSTKKCEGHSSQFIHSHYGIGKALTVDLFRDRAVRL